MAARLDGTTVLVVDDQVDLRDIFSFILQAAGATAIGVASAEAAVTTLHQLSCDVIVTDLRLPRHDAFWLLEQVERRPTRIPVIVASGHPHHGDAEGFARWLMKPVEPDTLVEAVAAVLGR